MKNYPEILETLLKAGASIDEKNEVGYTVLHDAARHGFIDVAEIVLKAGANVNARANDGSTALFMAAQNAHLQVVLLLLKFHADIDFEFQSTINNLRLLAKKRNVVEKMENYIQMFLSKNTNYIARVLFFRCFHRITMKAEDIAEIMGNREIVTAIYQTPIKMLKLLP